MKTEVKVPAIRFEGFSGAWEGKSLGDNATFSKGQGYSKGDLVSYGTPVILYGRLYTKYQTAITEVDSFVIGNSKSIYSNGGEVIVPASGETAEDISRASAVLQSGILLGGDLNIIHPSDKLESVFLALTISNGKTQKILSKKAQGKSVVHIRNNDLKEVDISCPCVIEQTKIGNYFRQLDTLIAQHQQKHDKLLNLKQALLEKMFPKQGSIEPEIRFKGFSGEWEEESLGDITDRFSGGTPQVGNKSYYNGHIPFIRSGEINGASTEIFISDSGLNSSSARLVSVGYILYALYGATSGEVGISKINGAINQAVLAIIPHKGVSSDFVMQWLRKNKALIIGTYLQGGQGNLSGTIVKNLEINLPSSAEQTKVGDFFQQFDSLISQHQAQLTKLNNIKQACLAKMFV